MERLLFLKKYLVFVIVYFEIKVNYMIIDRVYFNVVRLINIFINKCFCIYIIIRIF